MTRGRKELKKPTTEKKEPKIVLLVDEDGLLPFSY